MAEIIKFGASEVAYHIRHDLREIPDGKSHGNEAVDPFLSYGNYSLLDGRCQTTKETNAYRKKIEKKCFQYKRKNLVHAVEIVVQCPSDCPAEQKDAFFKETYHYICSTLPMGEECVFVAQVHVDERHYSPTGQMVSKDHLHVMYVPAVKDNKHEGFEYRLCADQLTKRAHLKAFHPGLQKHLDESGIHATVFRKNNSDGKTVSLSVSQLKELTKKTGITLDHSLTMDELAAIIKSDILRKNQLRFFQEELQKKEKVIDELVQSLSQSQQELKKSREIVRITHTEYNKLLAQSKVKDQILSDTRQTLREHQSSLSVASQENDYLRSKISSLEKALETKSAELTKLQAQTKELIKKGSTWGYDAGWRNHSASWGKSSPDHSIKHTEDIDI